MLVQAELRHVSHAVIPVLTLKVHYLEVNAVLRLDLWVKHCEEICDAPEDWTHQSHFCHTYYDQSSRQAYYAGHFRDPWEAKSSNKGE